MDTGVVNEARLPRCWGTEPCRLQQENERKETQRGDTRDQQHWHQPGLGFRGFFLATTAAGSATAAALMAPAERLASVACLTILWM
jgi:hypothetical protein